MVLGAPDFWKLPFPVVEEPYTRPTFRPAAGCVTAGFTYSGFAEG